MRPAFACLQPAVWSFCLLAVPGGGEIEGGGLEALDPDSAACTRLWDGKGIPDRYIVIFLVNEEISLGT